MTADPIAVELIRGAIRAATWLASQRPGWYEMADALDLPG